MVKTERVSAPPTPQHLACRATSPAPGRTVARPDPGKRRPASVGRFTTVAGFLSKWSSRVRTPVNAAPHPARGSVCAVAAAASLWPARAATPRDTLVMASAFDDIISLDPTEAFEISAGELMGNGYERLLRYDVNDPSKLVPDLAREWSVAADGRIYTFTLKPRLRFASGNALTAEDVVFSLQRAVILDKNPAFILTQFGLSKANVAEKVRQTGSLTLTLETDKPYAPTLVYNCLTANVAGVVDKKLLLSRESAGDLGHGWLKTNFAGSGPLRIREWRANEIGTLERNDDYHG